MMEYFVKMKYSGKPNPKNYNSLEFSQSEMGFLSITLRQHSQKVCLFDGSLSMLVALDELALLTTGLPGQQARPWLAAKLQSGPILSRSSMLS